MIHAQKALRNMNLKTLVLTASAAIMTLSITQSLASNIFMYPSHSCAMYESKPSRPWDMSDQWEIDRYNSQVRSFNYALEEYNSCIQQYLEDAKEDIRMIQRQMESAISDYNLTMSYL